MTDFMKMLGLEGRERPARSDDLFEEYLDLMEDGKRNGYTPVIIFDTKNDPIAELVEGIDAAAYRDECLKDEARFEEAFGGNGAYEAETCEYDDETMEEALLIPEDAKAYLVKVPSMRPYEAFAYLPFLGGYGDCPGGRGHIAAAHRWYEKFGAVPMAVTTDSVQYFVPGSAEIVRDTETVRQITAYCPSIVEDIPENRIAYEFSKVHNWFFYWE